MAPISPTVAAWELGLRIRERRDEAGLSGATAAKQLGIAPAYLCDLEHGKKTISQDRLDILIDVYEYDEDSAAELHTLREQATYTRWWGKYATLFSQELVRFFGFEFGAERVDAYDSGVINGLLQTEDYARAIIEAGGANLRYAEVDRRVECRMARQRRITGPDPLHLNVVMSEAVLWQQVGGANVLAGQMQHLAKLIETYPDNLEVRVVPFGAIGHSAMGASAFHLMTLPSARLPAMLWLESVTSTQLSMDRMVVREYDLAHTEALESALSREDSLSLVQTAVMPR